MKYRAAAGIDGLRRGPPLDSAAGGRSMFNRNPWPNMYTKHGEIPII
jgi:hypothetical protein